MKNLLLTFSFALLSIFSFGQKIQGDIAQSGRKMTNSYSDTISAFTNGWYKLQFSVNAEGKVTTVQLIEKEVEKNNTPSRLKAMKYVKQFEFQPGTWFPKYHQGTVTIYVTNVN